MRIKKYQKRKYLNLLNKYLEDNQTFDYPIKVEETEWTHFLKAVRILTKFYVDKISMANGYREVYLSELDENSKFEVIRDINHKNHPWIHRSLLLGEIFYYSGSSMYGSINRQNGLSLIVDNAIVQINYEYIDRIKN